MQSYLLLPPYFKSKLFSLTEDNKVIEKFVKEYYRGNDKYSPDILEEEVTADIAVKLGYHFCNCVKMELQASNSTTDLENKLIRLGSKYGGWKVLSPILSDKSIVYAVGAGTDISFELELINKFNCFAYTFDPTPQAMEYVFKIARENKQLIFHPYGVFSRDTILNFYRPRNLQHGSLSATNIRQTEWSTEAPVLRLRTIMREFQHNHIDVLKIDIEGAEYDVIEDIFFERLDIKQISVEFDQPVPPWRTERCIKNILLNGYTLVDVDSLNFTFIRTDILEQYV